MVSGPRSPRWSGGALACAAVAAALLCPGLAAAQIAGHGATSTPSFDSPGGALGTSNSEARKAAPERQPPALPGAASAGGAAPATKLPTDMSPNDALFDAINRGDIDAARDSISRGADLGAHNLLGMTPMELSVDLGRNDISFLLLSYRGGDGAGQSQSPATAAAGAKPAAGKTAKHGPGAKQAPVAVAAPRTPRLFAGDGGTPIPAAGFLGFDAGRSQP